jgi:hypothetical protein
MKIYKTSLIRSGFVGWPKTGRLNLNFSKFWNKNPKKTTRHFKNFSQNKIQKFIIFRPGKFKQVCPAVKSEKIDLTGSF